MQVAYPHFDISFGCFVFGLGLFAFQKISLGIGSFVFHWWWIDCSFLRLRNVLQWSIVGFALTAIGSFVLTDNGMEYLCVRSLDCMGYLFS